MDHPPPRLAKPYFTDREDPFALFADWLAEAEGSEPNDPNAMAIATAGADGLPDLRMVLMKGFGAGGFVFFTNAGSAKARQLAENPRAAVLFHWKSLRRQVRARGTVSPASAAEADAYFATRSRQSRLGAWASRQSSPLASRDVLLAEVDAVAARFADGDVPRPDFWRGYRLAPETIEFWQDGAFRLHDRVVFTRAHGGVWRRERLYP